MLLAVQSTILWSWPLSYPTTTRMTASECQLQSWAAAACTPRVLSTARRSSAMPAWKASALSGLWTVHFSTFPAPHPFLRSHLLTSPGRCSRLQEVEASEHRADPHAHWAMPAIRLQSACCVGPDARQPPSSNRGACRHSFWRADCLLASQ